MDQRHIVESLTTENVNTHKRCKKMAQLNKNCSKTKSPVYKTQASR